jgi:hypothetical protein
LKGKFLEALMKILVAVNKKTTELIADIFGAYGRK